MRYYLFFIPTLFSLSCHQKIDLKGHWHILPTKESILINQEYEVIEVENDSIAIWGNQFFGSLGGWITQTPFEQTIRFGGECLYLQFEYYVSRDTLYLTQVEYNEKSEIVYNDFKGYKCEEECCNKEKEIFLPLGVDLELPIVSDSINIISYDDIQRNLNYAIFYGLSQNRFGHDRWREILLLGDKISSPHDIPIWDVKNKLKVREEWHEQITITIFADNRTNLETVKATLEILEELSYQQVYLAQKSEDVHENFKIWLKPFDLSNLEKMNKSNDFRTVGEWLNND